MNKVDTIYIQKNNGTDIESFNILNVLDAKREAANLSAYHGEEFIVVIKNETREPVKIKTVALDKKAKFWFERIKVYHQCAITDKLEEINV